jgi:hypothetical protein
METLFYFLGAFPTLVGHIRSIWGYHVNLKSDEIFRDRHPEFAGNGARWGAWQSL